MHDSSMLQTGDGNFSFKWGLAADHATLNHQGAEFWSGSLLPLFWVQNPDGIRHAVEAVFERCVPAVGPEEAELQLRLGSLGTGSLQVRLAAGGVQFTRLTCYWLGQQAPAVIALYFGCKVMTPAQRAAAPNLDRPFWSTWRAEGFGLAGAKTNPMQSFFRSWDFGHADIPLGSFGPAMGAPYGAAFPRPTYAGGMGGQHGWVCIGTGSVPDAALTWQVRARSGAIEWLYREDLWGAPQEMERTWEHPLRLTWAHSGWEAHRSYFRTFPTVAKDASHQKTFWGTWGDFRLNRFDLKASIDRAVDTMNAKVVCVDDPWEHTKGSCRPHPERLPHFDRDLAHAHARGVGVGIWMPIIWLENPGAYGLTIDDLLLSRDGVPVTSNWAVDPHEPQAYFCLDPSSPRTRAFLRKRTQRVMRDYRPALLKIDFGYGAPGPDACTPRDPALRGERQAWVMAKLIADTARKINPDVTILGYSIHPAWDAVQDQCSLDDLGDAGPHEGHGHGNWSVWASLLGERGIPLMGSSGYLWSADADVVLNSAILGSPGANLPTEKLTTHASSNARRRGLFRWHRRTTLWQPLWLDSSQGNLEQDPIIRNWGRVEIVGETPVVTALALRMPSPLLAAESMMPDLQWQGRWAIMAQGNHALFAPGETAIIAYDAGFLAVTLPQAPERIDVFIGDKQTTFSDWTWSKGQLRLTVDEWLAKRALMGFVVIITG